MVFECDKRKEQGQHMVKEPKHLAELDKNIAQYDTYAKKILSQKIVLAYILVNTVDEFKGMDVEDVVLLIEGEPLFGVVPVEPGMTNYKKDGEKIAGFNTENAEANEGLARFDIVFYVRMKDGVAEIIINIEAQKGESVKYDILNRATFYTSRLISSQKERDFTGSDYDSIKPVYSIWICFNMPENSMNHFHMTEDCNMGNKHWKGKRDIFNIVMIGVSDELPQHDEEHELHHFVVANTIYSLQMIAKLAGRIPIYWWIHESMEVYSNLAGMEKYVSIVAPYTKIFAAGHRAKENLDKFCKGLDIGILEFGLKDEYIPPRKCESHDRINFICPSTVSRLKGQDIFSKAIRAMDDNLRKQCRFIFLGELRDENQNELKVIEELADEYENVELHPSMTRTELLNLYYDMDVVVVPSREDATPATIVEAFMYHKIGLCSDGTGVSRYMTDGQDGFVFKNENVEELKKRLEYIVLNFDKLGDLRERGRRIYETTYSQEIFEKNVFEKLV